MKSSLLVSLCLLPAVVQALDLPEPFEDEHLQSHCLNFAAVLFPDELIAEMEREALIEFQRESKEELKMSVTELLEEDILTKIAENEHESSCCGVAMTKAGVCLRCQKSAKGKISLLAFGQWHLCEYDPVTGGIISVERESP